MRIGDAAAQLGVAAHVLRHWEDAGVVVPARTATGHRDYRAEHLVRLRILQSCQAIGMSLADIRLVLDRRGKARAAVIGAQLKAIRRQQAALTAAEAFLEHVIGCRHGLMTRCSECSAYGAEQ